MFFRSHDSAVCCAPRDGHDAFVQCEGHAIAPLPTLQPSGQMSRRGESMGRRRKSRSLRSSVGSCSSSGCLLSDGGRREARSVGPTAASADGSMFCVERRRYTWHRGSSYKMYRPARRNCTQGGSAGHPTPGLVDGWTLLTSGDLRRAMLRAAHQSRWVPLPRVTPVGRGSLSSPCTKPIAV